MADSNSKATVVLEVNGQQASQTLEGLREIAIKTRKEMEKAAAAGDAISLRKLKKGLNSVERSIRDMESTGAHLEKVLSNLGKATPNELQRALITLQKHLKYVERGTKEWDEQVAKIKAVKNEISVMNDSMKASLPMSKRFLSVFNDWAGAAAAAALSIGGIIAAGKSAVEQYASMQQEESNVRKYTGMTEEQVNSLNDAFKKIDTRTSREELNKLAQEAGRLGMQSEEDVLGFVRAADKINVALDELGDGATLELSKLTDIFGAKEAYGVEQSLLKVGSVINELSQNSTASASYLEEFAKRMAGVGKVANMTIPDIMGFAAVLDSNGQAVEMSASSLSKLVIDIFKESGKIAKAVGFDVKEFSDLAKKDANEALLALLQRLKDLGGIDTLAPMFKDMGENGTRMSGVLAALVANIDQVRTQQEAANMAFQEGTSITNEFNVQNTTVQAGLEKARKQFTELAVSLGEKLLPIMSHFISGTSATLRVLSELVDFIVEYKGAIVTVTAAIVAYTAATKAKMVIDKTYNAVVSAGTLIQRGFNAALAANPIGLIVAGITAAVIALKEYFDKLDQARKETDMIGKANARINEQYFAQEKRITQLVKVANSEEVSIRERKKALEELNRVIPNYNGLLVESTGKLIANTNAVDEYLKKLKEEMVVKAYLQTMQETLNKQAELEAKKAQLQADNVEIGDTRWKDDNGNLVNSLTTSISKKRHKNKNNDEIEEINGQLTELEKQYKQIDKLLDEKKGLIDKAEGIDNSGAVTSGENAISTTTPVGDDELAGLKKQRAKLENELLLSYARQEVTKKQYEDRMLEIEREYYENALKLYNDDDKKKAKMRDKIESLRIEKLKVDQKLIEKKAKEELEGEKQRMELLKIEKEKEYNEGKIKEEQYNKAIFDLDIEYLDKRLAYETQFGNAESVEAEKRIKTARHEADERKKTLNKEKEQREEIRRIMNETFGTATDKDNADYEEQAKILNQVKEAMLESAGSDEAKRRQIIESSELAILELKRKYYQISEKEYQKSLDKIQNKHKKFFAWLNSEEGQVVMSSADTIIGSMTNMFSQLNSLMQAEVDAQTAAIERNYDGLLSRAEGNKNMEVELERQKNQEIADIKNAASKKMYAMEVMTAVAEGAMAAINAYQSAAAIPIVGFVLGPIAAAAAAAATGIQIATIKKQQQAAESTGYAEGGFTSAGRKYDVAGVVHAGEWVASQELVNSPVARPIINTLEQAQRTNTIASLRRQDVSDTITAPATISRAISTNGASSAELSATLAALTRRLNEPFVTVNTVSGNNGINKALQRYEQLKGNKQWKY